MTRLPRHLVLALGPLALSVALCCGGCEGTLTIDVATGGNAPPSPLPTIDVDGGMSDGGAGVDAGGSLSLCTLPPAGECTAAGVARWCEGTTTREETCTGACEMITELGRFGCASGSGPTDPPDPPVGDCGNPTEQEELALTNQARSEQGLGPLACDATMTQVARAHSQDMCDQGYFNHTSLDGRSPFDRMRDGGVNYGTAGENIAAGQQTAASVHNSWMNSSGHRANILNGSFGRIGIGYVECGGSPYWTQVFAD